MESERLRQFCVVADSGSMTKAAEILNISLGGLSKSLKVLEEDLGFSLFIPAGRGVAISDRGLSLYNKARLVLDSIAELKANESTVESTFRVGVLEIFSVHFMGWLITQKFPDQRLEIIEAEPSRLEFLLLNQKIDCGLTYLPHPQLGLDILKIGSFFLRAYGTKSLLTAKTFPDIPFIVPATGLESNPMGIKERDGWPEDSLRRLRFHHVNMLSTALDLARQGLGAVFMPDFVARLHNETHRKEFQLEPLDLPSKMAKIRREVFLLKRSGTEEKSEIKKLVAGVRLQLKI